MLAGCDLSMGLEGGLPVFLAPALVAVAAPSLSGFLPYWRLVVFYQGVIGMRFAGHCMWSPGFKDGVRDFRFGKRAVLKETRGCENLITFIGVRMCMPLAEACYKSYKRSPPMSHWSSGMFNFE